MKKYILTTFSLPIIGKEAEYNQWYDNIHCPDLLMIPAVKTAQRFFPEPRLNAGSPYLAIYELETDDINSVMQSLQDGTYAIRPSNAIDTASVTMQVYQVWGEKKYSANDQSA
jgi:hypothetical protein